MVETAGVTRRFFVTRALRLLLLASLTIAALLLGLMGMHALSAGADAQSGHGAHSSMAPGRPAVSLMTVMPSDGIPPATVTSSLLTSAAGVAAPSCSGMCAMDCLLLGMVCALSLLVALIGLVLSKRPSPPLSGVRQAMRIPRIETSVFVLPTTPSLTALSISRT